MKLDSRIQTLLKSSEAFVLHIWTSTTVYIKRTIDRRGQKWPDAPEMAVMWIEIFEPTTRYCVTMPERAKASPIK